MIESAIVFLVAICAAGLLCQLASNFIPAGTPRTIAHILIVLAALGIAASRQGLAAPIILPSLEMR